MTVSTKSPNEDLPADEGHQAFRDRKTPDDNPVSRRRLAFFRMAVRMGL